MDVGEDARGVVGVAEGPADGDEVGEEEIRAVEGVAEEVGVDLG